MGGCTSRQKNGNSEKSSLNTKELEECQSQFKKLSRIPPGSDNKCIALEGFKTLFPENQNLSEKIFKWLSSQSDDNKLDLNTFIASIELLTKPQSQIYMQSFQFKNLEQFQLLLLISIDNPNILKKDEFKYGSLRRTEISYLQAGIFIKEIINSLSRSEVSLCEYDDLAPKLLINQVFGKVSSIDMPMFCNTLKMDLPYLNDVIRRYFIGKFSNTSQKIRLPTWSDLSQIIDDQILGLFVLSTSFLNNINQLRQLYRFNAKEEDWNFDNLAKTLLGATTATIILFRHCQFYGRTEKQPFQSTLDDDQDRHETHYKFGFYCSGLWKISPEITGDSKSSIFSIVPKYKQFTTKQGLGQSKFAVLSHNSGRQFENPIKVPGLGIGGSGYDSHRIWIDGNNLHDSYVQQNDRTFLEGELMGDHLDKLNIDLIEVWGLEQNSITQSQPLFRQTLNKHIKNLVSNDHRSQSVQNKMQDQQIESVLDSLRKSQSNFQHNNHEQPIYQAEQSQYDEQYDDDGFQVEPVQH